MENSKRITDEAIHESREYFIEAIHESHEYFIQKLVSEVEDLQKLYAETKAALDELDKRVQRLEYGGLM